MWLAPSRRYGEGGPGGLRSARHFAASFQCPPMECPHSTALTVSFLMIRELGVGQVFASDRHFEQKGSAVLP